MKSFEKDIKKYSEKTRLKMTERQELRERILSYMEYHPLPKQRIEVAEEIQSERFVFIPFNKFYASIASSVLAVFVLVFVPIAAEKAVPGDVLYPFKTEINEGIRAKLANSPYEKVVLQTELLERRIAEARLLKSEGKLTDEVEAAISEEVREHAKAAGEGIVELKNNGEDEATVAAIAFESALEVQSAVLDAESVDATSTVPAVAKAVKEALAGITKGRPTSTPSIGGLMALLELETTRAYELSVSIQDSLGEEENIAVARRLEDIGRKIEKARQLNEEGGEAVSELISALALTQKLILFMTDIEVSQSVALETLIPIELTLEERVEIVEGLLDEARAIQAELQGRISTIEDGALLEKLLPGMDTLDVHVDLATTSLAAGDIEAAENAVAVAYEYATDLRDMTRDISGTEVVDEEPEELVEETPADESSEDTGEEQIDETGAVVGEFGA